jgi:hypothetical protein
MIPYRIQRLMLILGGLALAVPALAQNPSATPAAPAPNPPPAVAAPAPSAPVPADADENFLKGLRRIGVMAGQVVECSPEAEKQAQISEAMDLANEIALHFGLRAAFNFVGALGYGSGHPFDKAGCAEAIDGWKQIRAKYLNK